MKKYKTVIWDLDGTLLDTLDDLKDSVNTSLEEYGYPARTKQEIRSFVGNGIRKLVELSVPNGENNPDFDKIFKFFKLHYEKNCNNKTKAYDGIIPLLNKLKEDGISMAIVSNKSDFAVKELADIYFKEFISSAIGESDNIRRKPYPDSVFKAVKELGADKASCVFIGDSEVDIKTAENSGIDCLSVSWGFRTEEQLIKNGAAKVIATPKELELYLFE